jgi:D-glycero-alpha-D-manno-heptose-7-phosphate kinase
MIITRTPFRISFFGGGSDIQSYYSEKGGCVLSTSINKYMYITIHPFFYKDEIMLKYSKIEHVRNVHEINHSIFRQVLKEMNLNGIEISSNADIPAGTGLGSSSTFTVSLLHALNAYNGKLVSKEFLASNACRIEIEELKSPIGKQDQYAAAFGGLNFISFNKDETVNVEQIFLKREKYIELQDNLIIFYTGDVRSAKSILKEQTENSAKKDKRIVLDEMCLIAKQMRQDLQSNKIEDFGRMLHKSWLLKKTLAGGISNTLIDNYYELALKNGASGGKLLGAGGGGFLLFYCEKEKQKKLKSIIPLKSYEFKFESSGSQIIFISDKYWEDAI